MDGKRKYSFENLQTAITTLQNQPTLTIRAVALQNNVPEATLRRHLKNPDLSLRRGPPPLLEKKEERALVEHVSQFSSLGLKISSSQLISKAEEMLKTKGST